MYLKVRNKKIEIKELKSFKERFKSLKFNLYKNEYALLFKNKKRLNTNFFCQRVDACFTDKNNKILYLHSNVKSEKRIFHLKAKNLYILPLDTADKLIINDTLKIVEK